MRNSRRIKNKMSDNNKKKKSVSKKDKNKQAKNLSEFFIKNKKQKIHNWRELPEVDEDEKEEINPKKK